MSTAVRVSQASPSTRRHHFVWIVVIAGTVALIFLMMTTILTLGYGNLYKDWGRIELRVPVGTLSELVSTKNIKDVVEIPLEDLRKLKAKADQSVESVHEKAPLSFRKS